MRIVRVAALVVVLVLAGYGFASAAANSANGATIGAQQ